MKFLLSCPTALALLSALSLTSAFLFTFESYLPNEPNCCRVHFDAVGNCKGNHATTCLTSPSEPAPNNLCVPNREGIDYVTGEVSVFESEGDEDPCDTAQFSVNWDTGEIIFKQFDYLGENIYLTTSCNATGFGDNDGCGP